MQSLEYRGGDTRQELYKLGNVPRTDEKKTYNYYQKTIDSFGARSIPTNPNFKNNQKGKIHKDSDIFR